MDYLPQLVDIPAPISISIPVLTHPSPSTSTSDEMKWLTRTPTSGSLPHSPPPSTPRRTIDVLHPPPSPGEPVPTDSTLTKAMKSLRSKPSFLSLNQSAKASTFPLSSAANSPQRDAKRWPFRPSPVRAVTEVLSAKEAGDHFARAMQSYEEAEGKMRRRMESAQARVGRMREWLRGSSLGGDEEMGRGRVDSGVLQHADVIADADKKMARVEDSPQIATGEGELRLPPLNEDVLWQSLFRVRNRRLLYFECVGCNTVHKDTSLEGGGIVWLSLGCGHFLSGRCFHRLIDVEGEGEIQERSGEEANGGCRSCAHLRMRLRNVEKQKLEARYRRLVDATRGGL